MDEPKFVCPKCKLAYASVKLYAAHVKVHPSLQNKKNAKIYIPCCFGCDSKFASAESFQVHITTFHKEVRKKGPNQPLPKDVIAGVKCPCCDEQLQHRDVYLKHLADHLKNEPFKTSGFICPLCPPPNEKKKEKGKNFSDVSKFRVHTSRYHPVENWNFDVSEVAISVPAGSFLVSPLPSDLEDIPEVDEDHETESEEELPEASCVENLGCEDNVYPDNLIKDQMARYYLKLESDFILPSTQVQDIASEIKLISELSHHALKNSLVEQLKKADVAEDVINSIVKQTFKHDPIFNIHHKYEDVEQLSTNHLRQKYWKANYPYIKPKQIRVGVDARGKNRYAHFVSIREGLTALLKNEKVRIFIRKSFEPRQTSDILKDYTDGTAYAEHMKQHPDGKCLQLHLFQDAFDFDAFGPTQGVYKINGVYYTLGNLPAEYRSKVDSILMTYLMLEKDMNPSVQEELLDHDKPKQIFKPLIEELEDLKINGIELDGEVIPVCLLFLIGDSLGQHTIGGFVKSFTCEFTCRFCPMSKTDFLAAPHEVRPLRTPDQYNEAVQVIKHKWTARRDKILRNFGKQVKRLNADRTDTVLAKCSDPGMKAILKKKISKSSFKKLCALNFQGVKYRPSPFNSELLQFHVCAPAMPPCLAHDLFEGIIKNVLPKILNSFIEKNWFDLDTLNRRIKSFKCRGSDARDAPTVLKNLDKLSGSAVENWNLLRLLPFIIGDLIQDEEDPMWKLYLTLKEICELVCAPSIRLTQVAYLKSLTRYFLHLVKTLLPHCLTPKMHWLAHYSDLVIVFGPLIRLFTLRFESKHMFFKNVGQACNCFINITKTLSQKYMYRFAYDHSSDIIPHCLDYDSSQSSPLNAGNLPEEIAALIPEDFTSDNTENLLKVTFNSVDYKIGDVMILDHADNALDLEVGVIDKILLHCQQTVHFIFQQKKAVNSTHGFYRLERGVSKRFTMKTLDVLPDYYPLPVYEFQGHSCITLKHSVICMGS